MLSERSFRIVVCCAVALGACGGNDDGDAESDRNAATTGDSVVVSAPGEATPAGSSVDDTTADTTGDPSGTTAPDGDSDSSSDSTSDVPAMVPSVTIPMEAAGSAGSTIAVAPDGSEVALWTPLRGLTVFDSSSGEQVRSAEFRGAGSDLHWTSDNRLVTTDDAAIRSADAATLEPAESVDLTLGPDTEGCSDGSLFGSTLDRESNAVFSADFHELGAIVCRVDIANSEMIATVIAGAAAPNLFVRPGAAEILVAYNAETQLGPGMTATLDGTTLEVLSTADGRVSGVTASDEIVEVEKYSYRLSDGGPIARLSSIRGGQPVGPYLYGLELDDDFAETLLLFDVTSAEAVYSIPDAPISVDLQSSDDGSTVAFIDVRNGDMATLSIQIFTTP